MLIFCYSSLDHSFYTCKTCKAAYSLCLWLSCLVITIVFFLCYLSDIDRPYTKSSLIQKNKTMEYYLISNIFSYCIYIIVFLGM